MAKKGKLELDYKGYKVTRVIHQDRDFPLVELTLQVDGGVIKGRGLGRKAEQLEVTEVTMTMTLFEANELVQNFLLIVSNTTRLMTPKPALAIPWGEGGNFLA